MPKAKAKFSVGDWVRFVAGPDKGRTTTLTEVVAHDDGSHTYLGYFCGRFVSGNDEQTEGY